MATSPVCKDSRQFAQRSGATETARAPITASSCHYFAVTSPGLTATRWLSYVLASHPDVYVAHGKFALDSVMAGDFHEERTSANRESLARGNQTRQFYESRPLEEVLALYRGMKRGARVYGCVHSYTMHTLAQAAASADTLADMHIANVVRHPVDFIASHEALVRAAEKHPRLYRFYLDEAFPQALRQFPELFLLKCPDYRAFVAFAISCHAVTNWIFDLCYPDIRHLKMEALTSDVEVLHEFCQELTGLTYSPEALEDFIGHGAINQHRPGLARRSAEKTHAAWEPWQQDMAHMMVPTLIVDWLEGMGYDLGMFEDVGERDRAGQPAQAPCLADCLRSMDLRHPLLDFMTPTGPTRAQIVEMDFPGYRLARHGGRFYGVSRSLDSIDIGRLDTATLGQLGDDGLCLGGATVAEVWRAIACVLASSPQLIEEYRGHNLIAFREWWFAVPAGLAMNLERMRYTEREQLITDGKLIAAPTLPLLKQRIDALEKEVEGSM